jgi:hypothetical protein
VRGRERRGNTTELKGRDKEEEEGGKSFLNAEQHFFIVLRGISLSSHRLLWRRKLIFSCHLV